MAEDQNNENGSLDYRVGYKRPPRHTQFKPGESGNPKGRPKKRASLNETILSYLKKLVTITNAGKTQRVPMIDAIVMAHVAKAAKGDHRSTRLVLSAAQALETNSGDNLGELLRQFR